MRSLKYIIIIQVILFSRFSFAGIPDTTWSALIGGTEAEQAYDLCLADDRGYVVAGFTESYGNGMADVYLVKTGLDGSVRWQKTYGGTGIDQARALVRMADGGYTVTGETWSLGNGLSDIWVLRCDRNGDTLWTKTYGGTGFELGYSVARAGADGLIVTGYTTSSGAGSYDVWLLRLDAAGDTLWTKTFGGAGNDQGYYVRETADNGFILTGFTASSGAGSNDLWVIKTGADGAAAWTRTWGGVSSDMGRNVLELSDGYLITGHTASFGHGGNDVWLLRTDTDGDTLWTRTWGGSQHEYGYSAALAVDGGFSITGKTDSYGAGRDDIWLLKTDASGDTLWTTLYGGSDNDIAYVTIQRPDGRFFLAGGTKSFGAGNYDIWEIGTYADESAPDNDMTLTADSLDGFNIVLAWNPGMIDSGDADSTVIWYRTDRYPAYAGEPGAVLAGTYVLADSADTLEDLPQGRTFYFALMVKDSTGYWSDTVGTACDSAATAPLDTVPPDNDMTLTASCLGNTSVKLSWNPGAIDSTDADSVGIWYKKDDYPDSAGDVTAVRLAGFALTDSQYTLAGLDTGTVYYFSLTVRDADSNWADTAGSACDTALTRYPAWWDENWEKRMCLKFRNGSVGDTLQDVPVLAKLYSNRINYSHLKGDGADLRFVDHNNVTELPYEIESWDPAGTSYVWFRVPDIISAGTRDSVWMYYDNPAAADDQDVAAVWEDGYAGVWHLDETGTGTRFDATDNDIDGTAMNFDGNESVAGITAGCDSVETDDYIDFGTPAQLNFGTATDFTWSLWVKTDYNIVSNDVIVKPLYAGASNVIAFRTIYNGIYMRHYNGSSYVDIKPSENKSAYLTDGLWHHVAFTSDRDGLGRIYLDGSPAGSVNIASVSSSADYTGISGLFLQGNDDFSGMLDEVRVSETVRSAAWMYVQYRSQVDSLIDWSAAGLEGNGDLDAPDNNVLLTATALNESSITLQWTPGAIDSADADSAGIWYRTDRYPAYARETGSVRIPGFSLTDSADTVTGLAAGSTYYFALCVRDSAGNWSDTSSGACDTAAIASPLWWNNAWTRRKSLSFRNMFLSAQLQSVPVLVKLHHGRMPYTDTKPGGADIRFIDLDNATELPYEIETWNPAGTSYVWVQVPDITPSGTADSIWMYYGNPGAADGQDTAGTWDNGYLGVWHLAEGGAGTRRDAAGAADGTPVNYDGDEAVAGITGAGDDVRLDDYIDFGAPGVLNFGTATDFTWSLWVKTKYIIVGNDVVVKPVYTGASNSIAFRTAGYNGIFMRHYNGSAYVDIKPSTDRSAFLTDGQWHNVVFTSDRDAYGRMYIDGSLAGSADIAAVSGTADYSGISGFYLQGNDDFKGALDEVHVSDVVRSAGWVACQYRSVCDSLINWGAAAVEGTGDVEPPDNDMILSAVCLDETTATVYWNPGMIDSADADSTGIWYRTGRYPASPREPGSLRLTGYALTDSADTVTGLVPGETYYFSLFARDDAGNWSPWEAAAADTAYISLPVWWDGDWGTRVSLRYANGFLGSAQEDVPALVKLYAGRIDYSDLRGDGSDIRFTANNHATELPYEIERWNPAGTSYVWVRVPEILAAGTADSVWMYYGNPGAADAQNVAGVWSGYTGVWHLNETGTGVRSDAGSNDIDGTPFNFDGNEGVYGVLGGADSVGTDDYISFGTPAELNFGTQIDFTYSFWVKTRYSIVGTDALIHPAYTGASNYIAFRTGGYNGIFMRHYNGNAYVDIKPSTDRSAYLTDGSWHNVVFTSDRNGYGRIYIDGEEDGSVNIAGVSGTADYSGISGFYLKGNDDFTGSFDEVRVIEGVLSADRVQAQYRSERDNLLVWGTHEPKPKRTAPPGVYSISTTEPLLSVAVNPVVNGGVRVMYRVLGDAGSVQNVVLEIHAMSGRKIATLYSGICVPGQYVSTWMPSSATAAIEPGMHVIIMQSGGTVTMAEVLLLR